MLTIDSSLFIGQGAHQKCYIHPDDEHRCIKVIYREKGHGARQRELSYYRILERRGITFDVLARYHGTVPTDMGPGTIYDLIRDHDGEISKTLEFYLQDNLGTPDETHATLLRILTHFKQRILADNIITARIDPLNLLYRKSSPTTGQLVIIDNVGNADYIPTASHIKFLGRLKMRRKWQKFALRSIAQFPKNDALRRALSSIQ